MDKMEGIQPNSGNDNTSESSRLVMPNASVKPSYINIASNLCAVIFLGVITYCSCKDGIILFSFHPVLMTIGWLVLMTTAINAVTPGDLATEWMPIRLRSARHWVLQVIGVTIIIIGFLVILSNKIIHNKSHFSTLHSKFGLTSLIIMSGTIIGGISTLYSLKLKQYIAPLYIKLIHSSIGLVTLSLGIITMILGLFSDWWSFGETLKYMSMILILIVLLFTVLRPSLKIYFRFKERIDSIN